MQVISYSVNVDSMASALRWEKELSESGFFDIEIEYNRFILRRYLLGSHLFSNIQNEIIIHFKGNINSVCPIIS